MVTIQGRFPSLSRLLQMGHLVHNDLEWGHSEQELSPLYLTHLRKASVTSASILEVTTGEIKGTSNRATNTWMASSGVSRIHSCKSIGTKPCPPTPRFSAVGKGTFCQAYQSPRDTSLSQNSQI